MYKACSYITIQLVLFIAPIIYKARVRIKQTNSVIDTTHDKPSLRQNLKKRDKPSLALNLPLDKTL